jgi:hypothetical protein
VAAHRWFDLGIRCRSTRDRSPGVCQRVRRAVVSSISDRSMKASGVGGEALGCSAVYGFLARRIQSPVPPAEAAAPVFNASAARASSVAASGRDEVLMLSRLE